MKKIGIFGGTFDPFHNQHLKIIKLVYKKINFDEIWILPTKQNPLKQKVIATDIQRINMIKLVIQKYNWIKLNDYEIKNKKIIYTIDTISYFLKKYPNYKFYFIIGSDNLYILDKWKNIKKLINLIKFIVVNRSKYTIHKKLLLKYKCQNLIIKNNNVSSMKIRNGEMINQINVKVNNYINNNLIYSYERLKTNLDENRTQHCINVGKMAVKLAINYNENINQALIAGTYHDICKQWSKNKMINYLLKYNKTILKKPFPIWHSYIAAIYLKKNYHFHDNLILNAISKHTTGAIKMNNLELIILLADKISIDRKQKYVLKLKKIAFQNLTAAFKYYLIILKNHLLKNNIPLEKNFWKIYNKWII